MKPISIDWQYKDPEECRNLVAKIGRYSLQVYRMYNGSSFDWRIDGPDGYWRFGSTYTKTNGGVPATNEAKALTAAKDAVRKVLREVGAL